MRQQKTPNIQNWSASNLQTRQIVEDIGRSGEMRSAECHASASIEGMQIMPHAAFTVVHLRRGTIKGSTQLLPRALIGDEGRDQLKMLN